MSWQAAGIQLKVEIALAVGAVPTAATAYPLEFETETAGVSTAAFGEGTFEEPWSEGWFTFADDPLGDFETGGRFADDSIPDESWTDVTCDVIDVSIKRWKQSRLASVDTGTCTIVLDDTDRAYDPLNTSGPYMLNPTYTMCRRGRRVRVRVWWNGQWWPLFAGFVANWPASLEPNQYAQRSIDCVDWLGLLAEHEGVDIGSNVGSGETVDARINRILDSVGVPLVDRAINPSGVPVQSTNLAGNALTLARTAAASDGGDLWCAPDGRITFRARDNKWQLETTNRSQWTLTNAPTLAETGEGRYEGTPVVSTDMRDTIAVMSLQCVGGNPQTIPDAALRAELGAGTYTRTDLICSFDADVAVLAQWLIGIQPRDALRFDQVVIRPDVWAQNRWPAFAAQLFDRLGVVHIDGSLTRAREALITGIEHRITPLEWVTSLGLEDVTGMHAFTFDESVFDGFDVFI